MLVLKQFMTCREDDSKQIEERSVMIDAVTEEEEAQGSDEELHVKMS